ncbi:MAG: hypothetical protein GDA51_01200 [Ekhidna sp.]|nr:hypothetical protein [Ekhidna sp.]MBC6410632.1 hypothetical protein [Ekhidna sp.]MBC6425098.1 hypothetical protein [Ekhidna sp.]
MKRFANLLCSLFPVFLTSCYEEEQFPDTPKIEFEKIEFIDSSTNVDSLKLTFSFEDGDANIGFPENDFSPSYDLFIDSEPKILTKANINELVPPVYLAPVVFKTVIPVRRLRDDRNIVRVIERAKTFPAFIDFSRIYNENIVFECPNIINQNLSRFDTIGITVYNLNDLSYEKIFTQSPSKLNAEIPALFKETFYNIFISIEQQNIRGTFEEVDFRSIFPVNDCELGNFNGRIPVFGEGDGESGTITYSILSRGLSIAFQDNLLRVRFSIMDQAGNLSNEVVTPSFRISEITP